MYPTSFDNSYGKVIHEQALSLVKRGYEIKVVCPVPLTLPFFKFFNEKYKNFSYLPETEIHDNIEVYYPRYISFPKSFLFKYSGNLMFYCIFHAIKKIKKNFDFDIIHAHFTMPDAFAGRLVSKSLKIPLITTIQATDLDISIHRNSKTKNNIKAALIQSKTIITPTPRLEYQLKNVFNIESKSIGYGIEMNKIISSPPLTLSEKYKNKILLVSVSRLINTKGLEYNIRAINELKNKYNNIKYLIIGDGPHKAKLVELVEELEVTEKVEFLGNLNQEETMQYISMANIFSVPSWQETFGLVYLEAMANSVPVIGCEGQGFDGIIKHAENGFLAKPKDSKSVIEIIDFILTNPIHSKIISNKGMKTVVKDYTFEEISKKIDLIYKTTI